MILKTSMKSLVLCCIVLICVKLARSGRDFSDFEYEGTFDNSVDQENYRTNSDELENDSLAGNFPSGGVSHEGEYRSPIREKNWKVMYAEEDKKAKCIEICGVSETDETTKVRCVVDSDSVICKCTDSLHFDKEKKSCRKQCSTEEKSTTCKNFAECKDQEPHKFCDCLKGTTGDFCEIVPECDGVYKDCKDEKGNCVFTTEGGVTCQCDENKKLHPKLNYCKECDCGVNGDCEFEGDGIKCICKTGYKEKGGKCEVCNCGVNGDCEFEGDGIKCICNPGYKEKGGKCEVCNCGVNGDCEFDGDGIKCICKSGYEEKNGKCEVSNTLCDAKKPNCRNSKGSCIFDDESKVIECSCPKNSKYTEEGCKVPNDVCAEQKPRCLDFGSCSLNNKNEVECDCPDISVYTKPNGCTVPKSSCMGKMPKCTDTSGSCILGPDKRVTCECISPAEYDNEKGCKVAESICNELMPLCVGTEGFCSAAGVDDIHCKCPKDLLYDVKKGCKISDESCDKSKPQCRNTGGSCISQNETVQCDCPTNSTYENDIGCKVPDETCDTEKVMCRRTKGVCVTDLSEGVLCKCLQNSDYDDLAGCKVSSSMCDESQPKCLITGGSCSFNNETAEVQCDCSENSTYTTGIGCKVFDNICDEKIPKCRNTSGSCINQENELACVCTDDVQFQKDIGCKVSDNTCKLHVPKCLETRGKCSWNKEIKAQCDCPKESSYIAGKGCIVSEEKCDGSHRKCRSTGGSCSFKDETKVQCNCPKNTKYNETAGCKVPDEICVKDQNKCLNTSGSCFWKDESAQCECPKDSKYEAGIGCKVSDEKCKKERKGCIESGGKYCFYNRYKSIDCQCQPNMTHLRQKGACVADPCIQACGVSNAVYDLNSTVTCFGPTFGRPPKCTCVGKEKNKAFDNQTMSCKDDQCFIKCGFNYDAQREEVCEGGPFGDVTCNCTTEGFYFDKSVKECRQNCSLEINSTAECQNYGECLGAPETGINFCRCSDGASGSFCEKTECSGKLKDCSGDKGTCKFIKGKGAQCICNGTQEFNPKVNYCEDTCDSDEKCNGIKTCRDRFCACEDGKGGDNCEIALGCDEDMVEVCDLEEATCVFDADAENKATCKCNDTHYYFDTDDLVCKDIFCNKNNACGPEAKCVYDKSTHTGRCECEGEKYFDYTSRKCEEPDKCSLMKKPCGENYKCNKGECVCTGKFVNGKCVGNLCKQTSCFRNAFCNDKDQCECKPGYFFSGVNCENGAFCISSDTLVNCTCPKDMEKNEKETCVAKDEAMRCEKNCGLGFCMKEKDGNETCKCVNMATLDSGICILKEKEVCGTQKLTEDKEKCNCTDQFTQSYDGITCRLINCDDKEAKEDCQSKGAKCMMRWKKEGKKEPGYYCECPKSYVMQDGKCKDPCSVKGVSEICLNRGQVCYNTLTEKNELKAECRCPPSLKPKDGKCADIAENAYLITNIFVLKNNYLKIGNEIDEVKLNSDLTKSMQKTFSDVYEYGYLYKVQPKGNNALNCSVYINFKEGHGSEIKRLQFQAKKVNTSGCDECEENAYLWPPNVLLEENNFKEEDYRKLEFCSDVVKNAMCGNHATCNKAKDKYECSCGKGFKPVISSIQESDKFRVQICEDIDECFPDDPCSGNTQCVNIPGDYRCECKPGFKKGKISDSKTDKSGCSDLCSPSPCDKGSCVLKGEGFDCQCEAGFEGSLCDRADDRFKSAKQSTVIVGAVLGTILGVGLIAFIIFYKKTKKHSGSEDFMTAPRMEHAEMAERRPARGVVNKSYE